MTRHEGDAPISAAQAERRLLVITAARWLPVGLVFGLTILLALERGLPLTQVGVLLAIQGFVVLGLELPTGGIADAVGRRPVLLAAAAVAVVSSAVLLVADGFWMFALALLLQGVFRALDSGPLEAWFVDALHEADPAAPVVRGLSRAATVLGLAIAGGALLGGGLVAWHPVPGVSALLLPFAVAMALFAGYAVLVAVLVREPSRRPPANGRSGLGHRAGRPLRRSVTGPLAGAGRTVVSGLRLLAQSPVLRALVLVEVFWSIAMIAFETLTPVRLAEQLGGEAAAGTVFGPASAAAWGLFAAGSALAGLLSRRIGVARTALLARVLNGLFVVGLGLAGGVLGIVLAYQLVYLTHGAGGPVHSALLHRQATAANRAVVLSLNSMVAGGAYSLGLLALTALAEGTSTALAIVLAGAFSILGALLYLPALGQERRGLPRPSEERLGCSLDT